MVLDTKILAKFSASVPRFLQVIVLRPTNFAFYSGFTFHKTDGKPVLYSSFI